VSNMTLSLIMVGFIIAAIVGFGVVFSFVKRNQYLREVQGKIKCIFLPEAGSAYNKIVDVNISGHEVAVPIDRNHPSILPRYYFDKNNIWETRYPENPFLGLAYMQVQIGTVYYYPNNPEPITTQAIVEPLIATGDAIFESIDSGFALVVQELDEELQKTKDALLKALSAKLDKMVVYGLLIFIMLLEIVNVFLTYSHGAMLKAIMTAVGEK